MGLKERLSANDRHIADLKPTAGEVVAVFRRKLLEETDLNDLARLSETHRRARLERTVGELLSREGPMQSAKDREALIRQIVDAALGLGVLEPLLADPTVTEIMVNGPRDVWVEREGRLERVNVTFESEQQLSDTIERIVSRVNRRVDESTPMVDARLPTGERVNAIIPPLSLRGPTLTIRRFPKPFSLDELTVMGSLDRPMKELLEACVRAKLNIVVSGGASTGKTTLLNALSGAIPEGERIVTIEDSAELSLQQSHVLGLESRPPTVEGKNEVTIRDLVRNSLRMRPDRIIVGEVRGGETLDMLQAMNTGHEGSLATVHANSTDDAVVRLETLASMSDLNVPSHALRDQINSAIEVIVQLARGIDGSRRTVEIATVASRRREAFRLASIATFDAEPIGPDRLVRGRFCHHRLPDVLLERLALAGERVPEEFGFAAEGVAAERGAE